MAVYTIKKEDLIMTMEEKNICMTMEKKYSCFEVRYPSEHPLEEGKYFGKTPIFEQALKAVKAIGGVLYGIKPDGTYVLIFY